MSLVSSMFAGVGGLTAYGEAMGVIGDNIANINTVGFKGSRTIFGDILSTSISSGSTNLQIGRGSMIRDVNLSFASGSLESTGNTTDVAIQGSGFFIVGGASSRFYTRAGQFILNEKGLLVGPNNLAVQGYSLNTSDVATGSLKDIDLAGVQSVPRSSSNFTIGANLDAAASAGTTFQSSINVYNSLGELIDLSISFTKDNVSGNSWSYSMSAASGAVTVGGGTGTVTFDSSGALSTPTTNPSISLTGFSTGAADLTVSWNLAGGDITSYAASSVTNSITQDGFSTGILRGLSVDADGMISGLFSNGQTQKLMQLGLADFLSPWGLTRMGNSLYAESASSGQPVVGTAQAGGFGSIVGSSLELSNVDLGTEFVNLIQTQRAYQANSRIITTVDEMLVEAVNLKR